MEGWLPARERAGEDCCEDGTCLRSAQSGTGNHCLRASCTRDALSRVAVGVHAQDICAASDGCGGVTGVRHDLQRVLRRVQHGQGNKYVAQKVQSATQSALAPKCSSPGVLRQHRVLTPQVHTLPCTTPMSSSS
eukprot:837265-Rhodomonas_salina.3